MDAGHSLQEIETHWSADDVDQRLEWLDAREEQLLAERMRSEAALLPRGGRR